MNQLDQPDVIDKNQPSQPVWAVFQPCEITQIVEVITNEKSVFKQENVRNTGTTNIDQPNYRYAQMSSINKPDLVRGQLYLLAMASKRDLKDKIQINPA